jgi:membrane protease YdiL (CAAX protease family)
MDAPNDPIRPQSNSSADIGEPRPRRVWRLPKPVLWVIAIGLLGVVTYLQRPEDPTPEEIHQAQVGLDKIVAPKRDILIVMGKLKEAMKVFSPVNVQQVQDQIDAAGGYERPGSNPFGGSSSASAESDKDKRKPAVDRLRVTMLGADTLTKQESRQRLDEIDTDLDPHSELKDDVEALRMVVLDGWSESGASSISDGQPVPAIRSKIDELKRRHGWFAQMALSATYPEAEVRKNAAADGIKLIALLGALLAVVGLALLAGLVLLIVGFVMLSGGSWQWRYRAGTPAEDWPNEPGSASSDARSGAGVWLETVAIFLASFLSLKFVGMALAHVFIREGQSTPDWLPWAPILGQWLCLLTIFWPLFRGMEWMRWKREIGWHRGQGVGKEVLAGIAGYLAGLPLYFAMALLMVMVMFVVSFFRGGSPMPPNNKVLDLVEGGSPAILIAVFILATCWAPIVEESIFRGALFGHLRRRLPLVLAALGSCMVFAVLHGYMFMQLFVVGTLGFWFAIVREWRGSLIASATGHFIHNSVVLGAIITLLSMAQG